MEKKSKKRIATRPGPTKRLRELEDTKLAMLNLLEDARELENKLREERDRIQTIISSMGEGLLVVDLDRKITVINPAAEVLLGVKAGKVIGKDWSRVVTTFKEEYPTPLKERSFAKTLKTGKTIVVHLDDNHFYQTTSGRKFPIVSITAPIKRDGIIVGAVKSFRDATREKQLQDDLQKEKEKAELIISSMGEGLFVIDKDYKIVLMNPVAEKLIETPKEEAIGKTWADMIKAYKGDHEINFEDRVSVRVLKEGKSIVTKIDDDHYYLAKSGKKFSVASITAPLMVDGEIIGSVKVFRDATAEKESKKIIETEVEKRTHQLREAKDKISEGWFQLQKEKARLTASINSLPIGFFIIDASHQIFIINPAMQDILGRRDVDWTFEAIDSLFRQSSLSLTDFCAHCRGDVSAYGVDDIDLGSKILRIISVPITIPENSEIIGSAILAEDVTQTKLLERAKDEFFAVASHELRTPLTAIRGNTSLIQEYFQDKIDDPSFKEMVSDMHDASIRLINIVNDFLDVSRLEQGKMEIKKEVFPLMEIVKESLHEFETQSQNKGLYLTVEGADNLPNVLADKDRVKQMMVNLLGNALNFTENGGIVVKVEPMDGFIKVKVSDTGVGISSQNQQLLFKKFQQAGERVLARDVTRGTGMGLYISKLLTEAMGGKIYLESSELGKGSTFAFEIPIANNS